MGNDIFSPLYESISKFILLTLDDQQLLQTYFKEQVVDAGEILIEPGKRADKTYFLVSGYLRYSKIVSSGDDQTIHLYSKGHFAASLNSFFNGKQAEEGLSSITEAELLCITHNDLEKLYNTASKWQIFGRKLMEHFLMEKEERIIDQLSLNSSELYDKLLQTHPDLLQNVPVKYIASYLGIRPESLSRIRRH